MDEQHDNGTWFFAINNEIANIAASTSASAGFDESIATNILNILNKCTTMSSDTTHMRTTLDNMYQWMQDHPWT